MIRAIGKVFAECPKKVFGKEPFADKIFVEYSLPSDLDTRQRTRFR
jgi:hypothetical protein